MAARTAQGNALGIEEFADLVAARIIALLAPRVVDLGAGAPAHLTTAQLSVRLSVPEETLRYWRKTGRGPKYLRGQSKGDKATILYRVADVEAWEAEHLVDPAKQSGLPAAATA